MAALLTGTGLAGTGLAGAVVGTVSGLLVAPTLYAPLFPALARRVTSGRRGSGRASGP